MSSGPYNLTLLSGDFVQNIIVFNYWTDGILLSGLIIVIGIIFFAVAKYSQVETLNALITTTFIDLIIAIMFWLFKFNGEPVVPTLIPILLLFAFGTTLILKITDRSISQSD